MWHSNDVESNRVSTTKDDLIIWPEATIFFYLKGMFRGLSGWSLPLHSVPETSTCHLALNFLNKLRYFIQLL